MLESALAGGAAQTETELLVEADQISGARPRRAIFALTASELRVARLAADGLTNRVVAERLFVTERTVETHLRQVYQKLDIRSRRELPARLDQS